VATRTSCRKWEKTAHCLRKDATALVLRVLSAFRHCGDLLPLGRRGKGAREVVEMHERRHSSPSGIFDRKLKILVVHNAYQQRGGEDAVVGAESELLEANGHRVVRYERHNDELRERGALGRLGTALETVWSSRSFRAMRELIEREQPDVVHFHNTFPLISPSAYYACAGAAVPVVQTLHNYRLWCPGAKFLRDGKVCEACLGRAIAWPAVVHRCYRNSRPATTVAATMLAVHGAMGSWRTKVDAYIALSEFNRHKFIEGGLPPERIFVKPNFVQDHAGPRTRPGDYALFVGRLSEEKGPQLLLPAWRGMGTKPALRIAGDGPLLQKLSADLEASPLRHVEILGRCSPDAIRLLMKDARFLVFPSMWYEGFPMTIAEAFASGLAVVSARLGSMAELVRDGETGLHFEPGDVADLSAKAEWAWNHPDELSRMGAAARGEYEAKYNPSANYEMLMRIYRGAMARSRRTLRVPA
jgi:glycosyltransferase involved in cell wall biosynthesis